VTVSITEISLFFLSIDVIIITGWTVVQALC